MICVCNGSIYGPILWGNDACYKEPDACTEDQSYGTMHVATCTYARSQVRALCQVWRTSYMRTQHAQRVVVKRNICTEDNAQSLYIKSVACTNMHNSSLINGIECMCMSQCLWVCIVPSLPDRFIVCHIMPLRLCTGPCVQQCKRVHKCEPVGAHACSCTMCEL